MLVERVIGHRRQAIADVLAAMPPSERAAAAQAFGAFARAAIADPGDDGRFTLLQPGGRQRS
jgi:hypothetical protein